MLIDGGVRLLMLQAFEVKLRLKHNKRRLLRKGFKGWHASWDSFDSYAELWGPQAAASRFKSSTVIAMGRSADVDLFHAAFLERDE